jgi:hypothetical protein
MRSSSPYRPRHRAPRRLTGVWMVLLAVLVTLVLSGPAGPTAPAYAATDQPTVSFMGSGPAPLACSSRPTVPNMTIKRNTGLVLANFTGVAATANLGSGDTVAVADGAAISVRLREGTYTITMVPSCVKTFDVEPTMITVVRALPEPSPSPAPPAGTEPVAAGPGPVLATSGSPGSPGSGSAASGRDDPSSSEPSDPADPTDPNARPAPDVEPTFADRPSTAPDGRGERLLALIAAICVFGVTSAIIRAIVAQRATGATNIM